MIIWVMGLLLIASFICFVIYAMKGGNLTIGFFILTIVWTLVYFLGVPFGIGKPFNVIEETFAQPALTYGSTIIQIICGAWFGRVLVDTGIAASISYRTAKVGEKSPVLATICTALVTCLIFTSAYGVGSAIAIGVILFPILGRLGVPKRVAVPVFTLSIGAAMWINSVLFVQFAAFYQDYKSPNGQVIEWGGHYLRFGIAAMIVQMIGVIVFILINAKAIKNGKPYEVGDPDERNVEIPQVPIWTYLLPVVPVALSIIFQWDAVPALFLASIIAFLGTGHMKTYKGFVNILNSTAKNRYRRHRQPHHHAARAAFLPARRRHRDGRLRPGADLRGAQQRDDPRHCSVRPRPAGTVPRPTRALWRRIRSHQHPDGHGRVQRLVPVRTARGTVHDLHLQLRDPVVEHVGRRIQRARAEDVPQERRAGLLAVHLPHHGTRLPAAVLETFRTPCRPAGLLPRPAGTPTSQCITQANATSKTPLAKDRT